MRSQDIKELIEHSKESIAKLCDVRDQAKSNDEIKTISSVLLKNTFENLRSCLDYIALDAYERLPNKKEDARVYYPYGKTPQLLFKTNRNKWFAELNEIDSKTYSAIYDNQDFNLHPDEQWLVDLCLITNSVKHAELQRPQKKVSNANFEISSGVVISNLADGITFYDSTFNGNKTKEFTFRKSQTRGQVQHIINVAGLKFEVKYNAENVTFVSEDGKDIISLINKSIMRVEAIYNSIYQH